MASTNDWAKVLDLPRRHVAVNGYSAYYAPQVHEGFTLASGLDAPARPWIEATSQEFDFLGNFNISKEVNGKSLFSAFNSLAVSFGIALQNSLKDDIWEWPRTTVRENGETVSSPRNIVDQGDLLNSYSLKIRTER